MNWDNYRTYRKKILVLYSIVDMLYHKRKGHVNIKQRVSFAIPGVIGIAIGTELGLLTPSQSLLTLFGLFMVVISIKMLIEGRISI